MSSSYGGFALNRMQGSRQRDITCTASDQLPFLPRRRCSCFSEYMHNIISQSIYVKRKAIPSENILHDLLGQ